ncbi:hypothetical protein GQ602_005530 [Ophiocordyceps camponoti-floridani]|uniref:Amidoligase enzyme n=1 Tax=Ophiocordyceps camponoti-floridani TaxID=2030778 RepID=A0A8H4VC19_9HYPO|nr:hypothetical protein GQ602_005530 [Ophiocordyceps camponoti-floridani]
MASRYLPECQFGIELEFVSPPMAEIIMLKHETKIPRELVTRDLRREGCFYNLALLLQSNGLPSAMEIILTESECGEDPYRNDAPQGSLVKKDVRIMDPSDIPHDISKDLRFHFWMFKPECDLTNQAMYSFWSETELNTPILHESEAKSGFPRINKALELIAQAHDAGVHVNQYCGLHVQISPVTGLTPRQAAKVITIVFLVEHCLLFHLCHPTRRTRHETIMQSQFASIKRGFTPSRNEILDIELRDWMPMSLLAIHGDRLRKVWDSANEVADVSHCLFFPENKIVNHTERCALNINGHHYNDTWTYTLEFRHAQSSFNKEFVANWTTLLLAIAKIGHLPASEFKVIVERLWSVVKVDPQPRDGWRRLLRILGHGVPQCEGLRLNEAYWDRRLRDYETKSYPDVFEGRAVLR